MSVPTESAATHRLGQPLLQHTAKQPLCCTWQGSLDASLHEANLVHRLCTGPYINHVCQNPVCREAVHSFSAATLSKGPSNTAAMGNAILW